MIHFLWDLMTVEFVVVTSIALVFGIWVGFYASKPRSLKGRHVMVNIPISQSIIEFLNKFLLWRSLVVLVELENA